MGAAVIGARRARSSTIRRRLFASVNVGLRHDAEDRDSLNEKLEAPPGFEPGMEVLQTSALPLGDGADRKRILRGENTASYQTPTSRSRMRGSALLFSLPSLWYDKDFYLSAGALAEADLRAGITQW